MITDFFDKKRGRKRSYGNRSQKKKKKSLYASRRKKTVPPVHDLIPLIPIIVRVQRNERNEWCCLEEDCNEIVDSNAISEGHIPPPVEDTIASTCRSNRIPWHSPEYFPILAAAIKNQRLPLELRSKEVHESGIVVPPSTIVSVMKRLGHSSITVQNCFPQTRKGLLSAELIQVLQDIIRKRDEINNGVSWKEAIQLIVDLGQCFSSKSAENHLDYLIRSKKLDGLKRGGKVVTAQSTTTERSQINREQQLRWHFLIESEWEFMRNSNLPSPLFDTLHEHFQLNLDETCFMCNDGILKIIGAAEKRHHDKNMSDSRVSITAVRCGNAAGANGPVVFLASGQNVNRTFSDYRLRKIYGLPEGSTVLTIAVRIWMTKLGSCASKLWHWVFERCR